MIRPAYIEDIPALIVLGERMYLESRYTEHSKFCPDKCAALARQLITSESGCVLVAEKGGEVIGWMAGGIAEQYFSRRLMAFEYGLFISPEHRGSTAGARLVKAFIKWAGDNGAASVSMGITTGVHEERTGALYTRMGLQRTGSIYAREIF